MWGEHKCGRCGDGAGAIYSVGFFVCSLTKQMECNPGVFSGGYARMAALPLGFRGVCFAPQGGHVARDCPQTPPSRPVVCHRCQQVCVCLGWRQLGEIRNSSNHFPINKKMLSEIIGHFPSHLFRIAILDSNPAPSHNPVRRLGTWCATALPLDQGPG